MAEKRRLQEWLEQKTQQERTLRDQLTKILDIDYRWWGDTESEVDFDDLSETGDEDAMQQDIFVSQVLILSHPVCSFLLVDAAPGLYLNASILSTCFAQHFPIVDH